MPTVTIHRFRGTLEHLALCTFNVLIDTVIGGLYAGQLCDAPITNQRFVVRH